MCVSGDVDALLKNGDTVLLTNRLETGVMLNSTGSVEGEFIAENEINFFPLKHSRSKYQRRHQIVFIPW